MSTFRLSNQQEETSTLLSRGQVETLSEKTFLYNDSAQSSQPLVKFSKQSQHMLEHFPLSVQVFAPDGRILHVNKAWEKMWEMTIDDLDNYNVLKDVELRKLQIFPAIKKSFAKKKAVKWQATSYKFQTPKLNGKTVEKHNIRGKGYPVLDSAKNIIEIILIQEDMTDEYKPKTNMPNRQDKNIQQKQNDLHIKNESQRLEDLLSNVPGVVWEVWSNPDKNQGNFVSKHIERMLGYTYKEWLSTPNFWLTIVHPDDRDRAAKESTAIFQSGEGGVSRFRWMTKQGETLWVESHSFVIKDKSGKSIGMRGVTMDISEREELEQRKDEFISIASHELKTPLTSLSIYIKILEKLFGTQHGEETNKYLYKMEQQIDKLSSVVNELLNVSRIRSGVLDIQMEPFSLQELLEEYIYDIQQTTKERTIKLKGRVKALVLADRRQIEQVITNLLSNALKYSPKGDTIVVGVRSEKNAVVVSVQDHGFGIAKKHQNKIFERFYRVYDDTDKTFPGLGMGLFISREIIKRHGGDIWLNSTLGSGSTFYFSLPYNGN